jgi:hypothetical protein
MVILENDNLNYWLFPEDIDKPTMFEYCEMTTHVKGKNTYNVFLLLGSVDSKKEKKTIFGEFQVMSFNVIKDELESVYGKPLDTDKILPGTKFRVSVHEKSKKFIFGVA